jgi:hypothetical protein
MWGINRYSDGTNECGDMSCETTVVRSVNALIRRACRSRLTIFASVREDVFRVYGNIEGEIGREFVVAIDKQSISGSGQKTR